MSYSDKDLEFFQKLYEETLAMTAETSHANIAKSSPFTQHINCFIHSVKELQIYQQLKLKESVITRPALAIDIDLNYSTPTGETNAQRLSQGLAPYDAATGSVIDLHHIGQKPNSPFAELPHSIHNAPGISSILHYVMSPSWRKDPQLLKEYQKETTAYWKQRGENA